MAVYTNDIDFDSLRQIYDIREMNSLAEFLLPGHSLCIIHNPGWREFKEREDVDAARIGGTDGRVRLITGRGRNRQGEPDEVLLGICRPDDQGYYRQKLDKNLKSPFLFAAWKRGAHGFRLIQERQTTACFPDFEAALATYLPDGFIPECSLEEKALDNKGIFDPDGLEIGDGGIE